jgi:hypothetical protein
MRTLVTTADDSTTDPGPTTSVRWFQRVFPVTVIGLLLIGVLALVAPPFRDQLRLSVTREPESYVDLYFAAAAPGTLEGGQATCVRRGSDVVVDFVVRSHLAAAEQVPYSVTVAPATQGPGTRSGAGKVRLSPGRSAAVRELIAFPPRVRRYVVTVSLPGRQERLRARCGAGTSA